MSRHFATRPALDADRTAYSRKTVRGVVDKPSQIANSYLVEDAWPESIIRKELVL